MLLDQPIENIPGNELQNLMKNAILMAHGIALIRVQTIRNPLNPRRINAVHILKHNSYRTPVGLSWASTSFRARSSTDAVIPSRAGYPTATLASVNRHKALANYHLMSDTPENLDYTTVAAALDVAEAVARRLAAGD